MNKNDPLDQLSLSLGKCEYNVCPLGYPSENCSITAICSFHSTRFLPLLMGFLVCLASNLANLILQRTCFSAFEAMFFVPISYLEVRPTGEGGFIEPWTSTV